MKLEAAAAGAFDVGKTCSGRWWGQFPLEGLTLGDSAGDGPLNDNKRPSSKKTSQITEGDLYYCFLVYSF